MLKKKEPIKYEKMFIKEAFSLIKASYVGEQGLVYDFDVELLTASSLIPKSHKLKGQITLSSDLENPLVENFVIVSGEIEE